jgi:membrane protease YdiL (CAAX protease family)
MIARTEPQNSGAAIILFLALTTLLSGIFWILVVVGPAGAGGGHYVEGLMWSPAVAAFLTVSTRRIDVRLLGLPTFGGKFAVLGYLTPLAYSAIAYALVWALGFGIFPDPAAIAKLSARLGWQLSGSATFVPAYFLFTATTGMVAGTARALGEEIGWRGFLAPSLVGRMGFTWGAIVTGVIWAAWHMPILIHVGAGATPLWFSLSCFTVMVLELSVMLTWIRLRSNSVWPCAIFHASHNLFIQGFFTPLTGSTSLTPYAIGEYGVAIAAVALVFAVVFWVFRTQAGSSL